MSKKSRRKFIQDSIAATGAMTSTSLILNAFDQILSGCFQRAYAQTNGINPRNYIYFQYSGGPSMWSYQLFLTPYSKANFVPGKMVGTKHVLVNGRYDGVVYETVNLHGINVPYMWSLNVAKSDGSTRPMGDLLANMLAMQGISTGNAGHRASAKVHFRAPGSPQSVTAMSADFSDRLVPAVSISSDYQFASLKNKQPVILAGHGNLIQNFGDPFMSKSSSIFRNKKKGLSSALKALSDELENSVKEGWVNYDVYSKIKQDADDLMGAGFNDLGNQWTQLRAKYNDLIDRTLKMNIEAPGLGDKPVGKLGERDNRYMLANLLVNDNDIRTTLATANTYIADRFALIEFLMKNKLTSSISMGVGGLSGYGGDEHGTGQMLAMYPNTMSYLIFSACLLELIDVLKEIGEFDNTVIDVGGEFNRSPKFDGSGSDHGWLGKSAVLYSGAIKGPLVIGNLLADPKGAYPGTWGHGAPVDALGGSWLTIKHLTATMSHLLNVPNPIANTNPVVKLDSQGIIPLIEKTKIVLS